MTKPEEMTEKEKDDLFLNVRSWLGYSGILHFQTIKELNGTVNAIWMEPIELDYVYQYVPRNVALQEGKKLMIFLETLEICKDWEKDDFEKEWVWILEQSITDDKE